MLKFGLWILLELDYEKLASQKPKKAKILATLKSNPSIFG